MPDQHNFLALLPTFPIDQDALSFFSTQPCARPYLSKACPYEAIPYPSRHKVDDTSSTFFSETINTHKTITRLLAILRREILQLDKGVEARLATSTDSERPAEPDLVLFAQLGSGLNGFPDTVHGGVLASLLDEALGYCMTAVSSYVDLTEKRDSGPQYTANMNISYRAPVVSPGILMVKAWMRRREGRKWFLEAQVVQDDRVCTEATGLFVTQRTKAAL